MNSKPENAIDSTQLVIEGQTVSLRRKIQAGFLLAVILTVLTGGGLVILLTGIDRGLPVSALNTATETPNGSHDDLLMRMRYGLAGGTFTALAVLTMLYHFLVRRIVHPLERTAAAAHQMVNGCLDTTAPVQDRHEIGYIGRMLNDLGVNQQELVLLVWNQTGSALQTIDGISKQLDNPQAKRTGGEIQAHLQSVRQNLGTLQAVAQSFDLYDVLLTGQKAVALEGHSDRST